ncbi:protein pelota [Anaeramoeba flamelloides]|uniref:Protein pelota homolog n=1 Tax=Anaeramoeba flamelloides TaxID=1746091 RepID=A0AAV7ZSW4_9EUKA|nr:protein pelota [Anaeramoeba flamelloides]
MKLVHKSIIRDGEGSVTLVPLTHEDIWHLYNLISVGDSILCKTYRRIKISTSGGGTTTSRKIMNLRIHVKKVEYNPQDSVIRPSGKVIGGNKFVKNGQFHTLTIEVKTKFTLYKSFWDSIAIGRLNLACNPFKTAEIGAVIMSEGLAHICLITDSMTHVKQKIEKSIPKKRRQGPSKRSQEMTKFFYHVLDGIKKNIDFGYVKVVILASPGFLIDKFYTFMLKEAQQKDYQFIIDNQKKFMKCHSSSGHIQSLKEILLDEKYSSKLSNLKATEELKLFNNFLELLQNEPDKVVYGFKHVSIANERKIIQSLMVTDSLFRSADLKTRQGYVSLVESVKKKRGKVHIFSSRHSSGEQLHQMSGVAAILNSPITGLESEDSDDQYSDELTESEDSDEKDDN